MSILTLSNEKSNVVIRIGNIRLQYLGPKNLVRFNKINKVENGVIYVDTIFILDGKQCNEEDYIDLIDLLDEFNYNSEEIVSNITEYKIIEFMEKGTHVKGYKDKVKARLTKEYLIDNSKMVIDNFAIITKIGSAKDIQVLAINLSRTENRALISLETKAVLSSNMSTDMLKRAVNAVKRNEDTLKVS